MIFVGVDWAEDHHDVCVMDEAGEVLGNVALPTASEAWLSSMSLLGHMRKNPRRWWSASKSTAGF